MAKLFGDTVAEDITLDTFVKDNPETEAVFTVDQAIVCEKGILLVSTNYELYEGKIKFWIPEHRKAFDSFKELMESWISKEKISTPSIPSLIISCTDGKGRDIEFMSDTKNKMHLDHSYTMNGNDRYQWVS